VAPARALRVADIVAAAPDAGLAAICLLTWLAPDAVGAQQVRYVVLLMLLEFVVIHSAAFMGQAVVDIDQPPARAMAILGFGLFYTIFVGAFGLAFHTWWPVAGFWLLTGNRLLGVLVGQAPDGEERRYLRAGWATGVVFYVGAVFLTLFLPLPRFGITPDVVARQGFAGMGGVWIQEPHRVVAAGFLYFAATAVSELFGHDWLHVRVGAAGPTRAAGSR